MLLIFPLEVVQTSFYVLCLSLDKFELLVLGILKFMKLGHLTLLVQYYFIFFFCGGYDISFNFFEVLAAFIWIIY